MTRKIYFGIFASFVILHVAVMCGEAATLTVTNKNNSGAGSLRQMIIDAAPGDTVEFMTGLTGVVSLNTQRIVINKSLRIVGPGANVLSLEMDIGDEQRVIHVTSGTVSISGLSITGGNLQLSSTSLPGGSGVLVDAGATLTLDNCMIRKNELVYENSGSQSNGTVQNFGTLTINNSSVVSNFASNGVGGISNHGTLSMTNTTVSSNVVFIDSSGVGGLQNAAGSTTMLNCTIVANGGGGGTGGVRQDAGTVAIKNTIIANNLFFSFPSDVSGVFSSNGHNLIGDRTGGSGFIASDLPEADPQLGSLANNGGTTYTQALQPGSPAINGGNDTGAPATDQRGVARPQSGITDVGAYEFGVKPPAFGKIVFVSDRDGTREIYTMDPDGTNQTRLTFNAFFEGWPRWSPDGTKIVFVSDRDGGNTARIYVMNADGSSPTLLTPNSFGVGDLYPSWSPDGSKIVFTHTVTTSPPTPHIYSIVTMNADGSSQTGVLGSGAPNNAFGHPIFSRDGSKIIYSHIPGSGSPSNIYSIQLADSDINALTTGSRDDFEPAMSPDGNIVAFRHDIPGSSTAWRIYEVELPSGINPGTDLHPFINPQISQQAFYPAWSPDGTKLIYHTDSQFLGGDLYLRDADGTNPIHLVDQTVNGRTLEANWSGIQTPTGTNVQAISGTTTVNFSGVSAGGTTTAIPINPSDAGNLPGGYSFGPGLPAFDITTTATYSAPVTVCVQVPAVSTAAAFNMLRLFHNEGGTLVDRTSSRDFPSRTICGQTSSLSPFAIAINLAPTAANVSVSGQVVDANGRGIPKVTVSIADQNGSRSMALTNPFGYFRFEDVPTGHTYIVTVSSKRYQFANDTQTVQVVDDVADLRFVALPTK